MKRKLLPLARDARPHKDATEVRSFMGLVQYSEKFMPDVASVAKPIQVLTRKGVVRSSKWLSRN